MVLPFSSRTVPATRASSAADAQAHATSANAAIRTSFSIITVLLGGYPQITQITQMKREKISVRKQISISSSS